MTEESVRAAFKIMHDSYIRDGEIAKEMVKNFAVILGEYLATLMPRCDVTDDTKKEKP